MDDRKVHVEILTLLKNWNCALCSAAIKINDVEHTPWSSFSASSISDEGELILATWKLSFIPRTGRRHVRCSFTYKDNGYYMKYVCSDLKIRRWMRRHISDTSISNVQEISLCINTSTWMHLTSGYNRTFKWILYMQTSIYAKIFR